MGPRLSEARSFSPGFQIFAAPFFRGKVGWGLQLGSELEPPPSPRKASKRASSGLEIALEVAAVRLAAKQRRLLSEGQNALVGCRKRQPLSACRALFRSARFLQRFEQ